jgi:HD superfamily phosphodiesterase
LSFCNRLDAIGAIGIARCFTFGGAFKRVLHDPSVPPRVNLTKEQYTQQGHQATTFNHFAEKLLKIKVKASACKVPVYSSCAAGAVAAAAVHKET